LTASPFAAEIKGEEGIGDGISGGDEDICARQSTISDDIRVRVVV